MPFPFINTDAYEYYGILNSIECNSSAHIGFPGIGYPLFLWFCEKISDTTICVVAMQSLLQLLAVLIFFYYYFVYIKKYLFLAAILIIGYLTSNINLYYDTAFHPDSLMGSLFIISLALLLRLYFSYSFKHFFLLSILVAYTISVRANGIVLMPILVLYLFYTAYTLKSFKFLFKNVLILCIPLLLLSTFNYLSPLYKTFNLFGFPKVTNNSTKNILEIDSNKDDIWYNLNKLKLSKKIHVENEKKSIFDDENLAIYVMASQRYHIIFLDSNNNLKLENYTDTRSSWSLLNLDSCSSHLNTFKRIKYTKFKTEFIKKYGYKKVMIMPEIDFRHNKMLFIGFFKMFYKTYRKDNILLGYENLPYYERNYKTRYGMLASISQNELNTNNYLFKRVYKELYKKGNENEIKGNLLAKMDEDYWQMKISRIYRWIVYPYSLVQTIFFRNVIYPICFLIIFFISIIGVLITKCKEPLFVYLFSSTALLLLVNFLFSIQFCFLYTRYTYQVSFVYFLTMMFVPVILVTLVSRRKKII